jgi:hypothetical protein
MSAAVAVEQVAATPLTRLVLLVPEVSMPLSLRWRLRRVSSTPSPLTLRVLQVQLMAMVVMVATSSSRVTRLPLLHMVVVVASYQPARAEQAEPVMLEPHPTQVVRAGPAQLDSVFLPLLEQVAGALVAQAAQADLVTVVASVVHPVKVPRLYLAVDQAVRVVT